MNSEIIKKIIAEWLKNKVFPPLIKRDAPDLLPGANFGNHRRSRSQAGREDLLYVSTDPVHGLQEAMNAFAIGEGFILTNDEERELTFGTAKVKVMPVWKWLML